MQQNRMQCAARVCRWFTNRYLARVAVAGLVAIVLMAGFTANSALAAPDAAPATAPDYAGTYYVVKKGDTLSAIARRFGTTVHAIVRANGLKNPSHIWVGQKLHIPSGHHSGGSYGSPYVDSTYYVVKKGDTMSGIARRFNTTVTAILKANHLSNPSYVYVGQKLRVPTGYAYPPSVYGFYYKVKPGDTLSEIAKWYGVSLHTLAKVNHISNVSNIYVGQKIFIP